MSHERIVWVAAWRLNWAAGCVGVWARATRLTAISGQVAVSVAIVATRVVSARLRGMSRAPGIVADVGVSRFRRDESVISRGRGWSRQQEVVVFSLHVALKPSPSYFG